MTRTFKFYRTNEAEVMERLGLKPTKNSGSGWVEKEDGQNDYVICQLKSTDKASISIKQSDINILEYNASVSHKYPVFAIQFLNNNDVWIMCKPEDITEVSKYISTGRCNLLDNPLLDTEVEEYTPGKVKSKIRSNRHYRDDYLKEREKEFEESKVNRKWKQRKWEQQKK